MLLSGLVCLSLLAQAEVRSLPARDISVLPHSYADVDTFNILSFSYSPAAKVEGDLPEEDIDGGDYSYFTLDTGTAKSIKWTHLGQSPVYLEYTSIDTPSDDGSGVDKYQSLSIGLPIAGPTALNSWLDLYGGMFFGLGGARFDLEELKYRAHAEVSAELALLFVKTLSLGLGAKYQIVGYPSETMAEAWYMNLTLGLWF